jgi:hypothetical protein
MMFVVIMDKKSFVFGVLFSLLAQGFYETIFYALQGKLAEEWAASMAVTLALAFLSGLFYWKGYFKPKQKTKQQNREERMKTLDIYQRYLILVLFVIIVAYLFVFLFLPVTIDDISVPTLVNGITTSMSIVVALGGVVVGIVFRSDIEKGDSEAKKFYFTVLGLFIVALVYPWGSYILLASKQFPFAVKYSFGGYLIALLAIIWVYIYAAKRLDKGNIEN